MNLLHGFCLSFLALLSAYIAFDHAGDRNVLLQSELQRAFSSGIAVIKDNNADLLIAIQKQASDYPSQQADKYVGLAEQQTKNAEALIDLLDSLECRPDKALIEQIQGQVHLFRSGLWADTDYRQEFSELFPKLPNYGWLYEAYESGDFPYFFALVEELKVNVALMQQPFLIFCLSRVSGECGWRFYQPTISIHALSPKVGDEININACISWYQHINNRHFYLDGQELPTQNGIASFELRYTRPGLYPLKLLAIQEDKRTHKRDSVESVYYLRVRE